MASLCNLIDTLLWEWLDFGLLALSYAQQSIQFFLLLKRI